MALVYRICWKIVIDACIMRLNYVPVTVKPKRKSYILDDEYVFVHLTSKDKDQKKSEFELYFIGSENCVYL